MPPTIYPKDVARILKILNGDPLTEEEKTAHEHIPYRTEQEQAEHDWMVKAHIKASDW